MPLQNNVFEHGVQVVVQTEYTRGHFSCEGFTGVPTSEPCVIRISGPNALSEVRALAAQVKRELFALGPGVKRVPTACSGRGLMPFCHAHDSPVGQKLLVLVSDGVRPDILPTSWPSHPDSTHRILPVLPNTARTSAAKLLPVVLRPLNAVFWDSQVTEALPAVFSCAGLTPERPRVFICYRQAETAALAIQLFDALSHAHFDVFLDHYRIPPGVDFQTRLTEDLGHKGMVLVLASRGILQSPWTLHEINIARQHGLGLLAIQLPGGPSIRHLGPARQMKLGQRDFHQSPFGGTPYRRGHFPHVFFPPGLPATARLRSNTLAAVVRRVRREHDRAYTRRRARLYNDLTAALLSEGISSGDLSLDASGLLRVARHGSTPPEYRLWLTPRPPQTNDFHFAWQRIPAGSKGAVIGLAALMERATRQRYSWLSGVSGLRLVDEAHLKQAAREVMGGTL
jgi:TIR domain